MARATPHSVISSSELEDDLTRHLDAHVRASYTSHGRVHVHTCMRERVCPVCPVCQESIRGVWAVYRAGESRGGRIDIKIVTEFRRAATYPNALGSPLNYPFSSRTFYPFLLPVVPWNRVPILRPFPDFSARCTRAPRVTGQENFSTAEEENIVVNRQSKFPTVTQKPKDNTERAGGSEDVRHKNTWRHEDIFGERVSQYMERANLFGEVLELWVLEID